MSESKQAQFKRLVADHDLTYSYSDDGRALNAGAAEYDRIRELAKDLPIDFVRETWNAKVDKTLAQGFRENFYWK